MKNNILRIATRYKYSSEEWGEASRVSLLRLPKRRLPRLSLELLSNVSPTLLIGKEYNPAILVKVAREAICDNFSVTKNIVRKKDGVFRVDLGIQHNWPLNSEGKPKVCIQVLPRLQYFIALFIFINPSPGDYIVAIGYRSNIGKISGKDYLVFNVMG